MSVTAGRELVDSTENSTSVGNLIPCLTYSTPGVVATLTKLYRIPEF